MMTAARRVARSTSAGSTTFTHAAQQHLINLWIFLRELGHRIASATAEP